MSKDLILFFESLGEGYLKLQRIKHNLKQSTWFNSQKLFKQISSNNIIELKDLYSYLFIQQIQVSQGEIYSIFKELDIKKKGFIQEKDFYQYFLSDAKQNSDMGVGQTEQIHLIKNFFLQIIDNHMILQKLRIKLLRVPAEQLYKQISSKQPILSLTKLKHYLIKSNVKSSSIENVLNYFKSRGETLIEFDYFLSLIEPYQQSLLQEQLPTTSNIIRPLAIDKKYADKLISKLENLIKSRLIQNKQRRQFLQAHQKSRKQLIQNITPTQYHSNSPKLSFDSKKHLIKKQQFSSTSLLKTKPMFVPQKQQQFMKTSPQYDSKKQLKLTKNISYKINKQLTQNNTQQFSFNNTYSSSFDKNLYNTFIDKQQQRLDKQMLKRKQLQKQLVKYQKDLHERQRLKQLQNIEYNFSFLKHAHKQAPAYHQCRSLSQNKIKDIIQRQMNNTNLFSKQYIPKNKRINMEQQLRKSRLNRQLAKFRLHKQLSQSKHLWRQI